MTNIKTIHLKIEEPDYLVIEDLAKENRLNPTAYVRYLIVKSEEFKTRQDELIEEEQQNMLNTKIGVI